MFPQPWHSCRDTRTWPQIADRPGKRKTGDFRSITSFPLPVLPSILSHFQFCAKKAGEIEPSSLCYFGIFMFCWLPKAQEENSDLAHSSPRPITYSFPFFASHGVWNSSMAKFPFVLALSFSFSDLEIRKTGQSWIWAFLREWHGRCKGIVRRRGEWTGGGTNFNFLATYIFGLNFPNFQIVSKRSD